MEKRNAFKEAIHTPAGIKYIIISTIGLIVGVGVSKFAPEEWEPKRVVFTVSYLVMIFGISFFSQLVAVINNDIMKEESEEKKTNLHPSKKKK